jgi:hypothetical protein
MRANGSCAQKAKQRAAGCKSRLTSNYVTRVNWGPTAVLPTRDSLQYPAQMSVPSHKAHSQSALPTLSITEVCWIWSALTGFQCFHLCLAGLYQVGPGGPERSGFLRFLTNLRLILTSSSKSPLASRRWEQTSATFLKASGHLHVISRCISMNYTKLHKSQTFWVFLKS